MFLRGFIGAWMTFCLVTGSQSQIQGTDTLYGPSDLFYFSEAERESFNLYFNGRPDYLKMILSVDGSTGQDETAMYEEWIADLVQEIRQKKFGRMNEVKKINRISNTVSQTLLITFAHQSRFVDLFAHGKYNYFTAAALYAFVLDRLDIPYEIREVSTSLLLLAYPEGERVSIDIEGPGSPFFMFTHDTRGTFVDFLRETNTIDEATFSSTPTRILFDRYYFADHGLTIRDVIGMMYLNEAIDLLNRSEPANAYFQLEKAFMLHPSHKSQYLLLAHLYSYLAAMEYYNPRDLGYLIKASRLIGFGVERELILSYLRDIIRDVLIEAQDLEGMQYIFEYMQEYLADAKAKREFDYLFHYEVGRHHYDEQQYAQALASFESAYFTKPEDENIQETLPRVLAAWANHTGPARVLEKMEYYDTVCTEIVHQKEYLLLKQNVYLLFFGEAFQLQDAENGERYMALFEEIAERHPDYDPDYLAVGRSYSSAAIYYYRQGRIQKSRAILEKGLEYAPDNIELKLKLKSFE
jgi:tetratricopeptide (TPR) repeat protein